MKQTILIVMVMLVMAALPLTAQMEAPKPLDDDLMKWQEGKWEGWFESPMGKSKETMYFRFGLDNQYMLMEAVSETENYKYRGMGALTIDPETGEWIGVWIDNFRGHYNGKGKRDGNKSVMTWGEGQMKSTRTVEKAGPDKMVLKVVMTGQDGKEVTAKGELTRVKKQQAAAPTPK